MKKYKKLYLMVVIMSLLGAKTVFGGWEMISPNPKMLNIEIMGDTWFGMEYKGSSASLFLSTKNNGHTWDTIPGFSDIFRIKVNKDRILVRGIYKGFLGFYISSDTAKTWKKLTWTYPGSANDMLLNDTAILMYVTKSSGVESPLYRSLDTGKTWHPLPVETGEINWNPSVDGYSIGVHNNAIGVFINSYGFVISHDGGNTWTKKMDGLPEGFSYGPLSVLTQGFSIRYGGGWYIFNGTSWVKQEYKAYAFYIEYDKWKEITNGVPIPHVCEHREPYMFAINGDAGQYIYYSIDNGKKWFMFSEVGTDFLNAFASSIVISGNYIYAGFDKGFARRSLSDAKNHIIKEEEVKKEKFAISPEEMENIINLYGAEALEELLDQLGIDSDELSMDEMSDFLEDYIEENGPSGLFDNSQPGTCSYMGMPLWSVNVANLKLFVRDVIFRKQGIGPEVKLAINYVHSPDTTESIFGKHWQFEYGHKLLQGDSSATLYTGTGAAFVFSENNVIVTGALPFSLPCVNNKKYQLHWTGTKWQIEKGFGFEFLNFELISGNNYALQSVEDAYGKKLTLARDAENRPDTLTDASGRKYRMTYKNGLCDSIISPGGRFVTFSYNGRKQLESSLDFNGVESQYNYDSLRNIASVDIAGKTTSFQYNYESDSLGVVSRVTDPEGRAIEYFTTPIDSVNRLTNITNPGNKITTYQLKSGMVTSITNSGGEVKKIFYNGTGYPDSLVWYDGSYITFVYDGNNNIISKRDRAGRVTTFEYNENRKLTKEKNALGETLYTNSYNIKNQLESITLANDSVISYTYDVNGALQTITKLGGRVHSFGRDVHGNIISHTNPLGHTMQYLYDTEGMTPTGSIDFNGNTYGLIYDKNGRLEQITMPDSSYKSFNYDCCTQTGITDENGNTSYVERDATNRILNRTTPEGVTSSFDYDAGGFISGFVNLYGLKKTLTYDNRGLLLAIGDEDGQVRFGHNISGLLVSVTDKKGNQTKFAYNENGKIVSITDAVGKDVEMGYNDQQRLTSVTNARTQTMSLAYDQMGRVSSKSLSGNTYASYSYNAQGELVSFTDSLGTTAYTRNKLGFITGINYPNGLTVAFEHDANGNVIKTTYPNGLEVTNTPDKLNRIVNISWSSSSVGFEYGPAGNLLSEERGNNTRTDYSYNKDNVLITAGHYGSDTLFAGETIVMEKGIIVSNSVKFVPPVSAIPVKLLNMSSNKLNQLEGNMVNHLSLPHDADGNLTAFIDNGVSKMSAAYSHDNMLTSINADGATSVKIRYGAMRYPDKIIQGGVTTFLYYDHKGRLMFETDGSGSLTKNYIYRGKRLIACQTASGTVQYFHYSRLGHTLAITGADGQIINSYAYSSTGEIIGKTEKTENRFTFLGAFGALRLDDNYILTGARVYSAVMGRYLQRDPLGIITGTNPYLYASNNPVAGIDPLGLADQDATVNAADFDYSSDNDYGTAAGTSDPYADNLPYRGNDWDDYGSAAMQTLKDFSDHPAADFIPSGIGNPMSMFKAMDKFANKEYGSAFWQFVPFNNSIDAAGNYLMDEAEKFNPANSSGMGIVPFNNQQTFTCDL